MHRLFRTHIHHVLKTPQVYGTCHMSHDIRIGLKATSYFHNAAVSWCWNMSRRKLFFKLCNNEWKLYISLSCSFTRPTWILIVQNTLWNRWLVVTGQLSHSIAQTGATFTSNLMHHIWVQECFHLKTGKSPQHHAERVCSWVRSEWFPSQQHPEGRPS